MPINKITNAPPIFRSDAAPATQREKTEQRQQATLRAASLEIIRERDLLTGDPTRLKVGDNSTGHSDAGHKLAFAFA